MTRRFVLASILALGAFASAPAVAQELEEKTAEEVVHDLARRLRVGLLLDDDAAQALRERRLRYDPPEWSPTSNGVTMIEAVLRMCELPFERCPPDEKDPQKTLLVVRGRPRAAPAAAPTGGPRVAVVDLKAAFDAHPRKQALEREVNARREKVKAELEREHEQLRALRVRIEQTEPAEREPLKEELAARARALEAHSQHEQRAMKELVDRATRSLMDEIQAVVAELARREGFAAAHAKEPDGVEARRPPQVLWAGPTVDVTGAVVEQLRRRAEANPPEGDRRSY